MTDSPSSPDNGVRSQNRASHAQIIAIHRKLEETLDRFPDGKVRFRGDWTDHKVASVLGVSYWTVSNLRREMFGDIITEIELTLESRIKKLEERVRLLEERPIQHPNRLL